MCKQHFVNWKDIFSDIASKVHILLVQKVHIYSLKNRRHIVTTTISNETKFLVSVREPKNKKNKRELNFLSKDYLLGCKGIHQ